MSRVRQQRLGLLIGAAFASHAMPAMAAGQDSGAAQSTPPAAPLPSAAATAPEPTDQGTPDIVVTATKRAQNLSQVPAAISAVSGGTLQQRSIQTMTQFSGSVPGLVVSPNNTDIAIIIRGVGHSLFSPSAENAVALHLDGVYLSRPAAGQVAFFDIDRVEVLRGPQGTLYGRNATGGAVNVISAQPTDFFTGYLSGTVANYRRTDVEGAIGGPIARDAVTFRVGGFWHRRRDGFGNNLFTGSDVDDLDEYGGKAALLIKASDRLKITLRGDYYHANDGSGEYHYLRPARAFPAGAQPLPIYLGQQFADNPRDINANFDNRRRAKIWGTSGQVNWDLGGSFALKSISAYRKTDSFYSNDLDQSPLRIEDPFSIDARAHQVSEELQLTYSKGNLFALLGGYYFHEKVASSIFVDSYLHLGLPALQVPPILPPPFGVFSQVGAVSTDAKAIFANAEWDVTDRLNVGAGLRYSNETKRNRGYNIIFFPNFAQYPATGYVIVDDKRKSHGLTPKFTLRYKLTDTLNVYASAGRGFKSGEFITGLDQYAKPEYLWAYEAGIKGSAFRRALTFALGGFYYDYTDLQVQRLQSPATILQNSPGGRLQGIEGEGSLALPAKFTLDANFAYLDTKIKGFVSQDPNLPGTPERDLTGNRFAYAPKFTYNIGLQKRIDFGANSAGVARIDFQHSSLAWYDTFNSRTSYRRPYSNLDLSYKQTFANGLSVMGWVRNLTNERYSTNEAVNAYLNVLPTPPSSAAVVGLLNDPRTYGVTVRYDFR